VLRLQLNGRSHGSILGDHHARVRNQQSEWGTTASAEKRPESRGGVEMRPRTR
jgi:hypothetical protein